MPRSWAMLAALVLAVLALSPPCAAYEFDMVFQTKCVMEEVLEATEVTGSLAAFQRDAQDRPVVLDVRFENPLGQVVFEKAATSETDFHFSTVDEGEYKLCFTASDYNTAQSTRIRVQWRTGAAAHDWESVAKKDNLNAIQTELLKLEQSVHDIHVELQYIRRKEEQMRNINEATNARVAWFSIISVLICVSLAAWQLFYLKRFFTRKKIL